MIITHPKLKIIKRTLPPAATPISPKEILSGLKGLNRGQKEINRFESELKKYYNVNHCFLISSGKAALTIILKAIHELHPERNEVLIPAYTCYSVPSAIIKAGLKIKLCDINPETLDFDHNQLTEVINNSKLKTSLLAVLPTHLFGIPSDMDKLRQVIKDKGIFIVEDAAQAMGTTVKDKKLGTLGDTGFFSLGRGKAFSTVEGGIILTNNNTIADNITKQMATISSYNMLEIIKLIVFSIILTVFMHPALFWFPKFLPFLKLGETLFEPGFPIKKLSPFQAGLSRNWQKKLDNMIKIRINNTTTWANYINSKHKIKNSKLPLLRFPIKINNPQTLKTILSKSEHQGLGIMRTYPDSVNNIKELKQLFKIKYPNATLIAKQLITLPVHSLLSFAEIIKIKQIIQN